MKNKYSLILFMVTLIFISGCKTITFNNNIVVNEKGYNFTIRAGDYIVNEDGNIYIPHFKVK